MKGVAQAADQVMATLRVRVKVQSLPVMVDFWSFGLRWLRSDYKLPSFMPDPHHELETNRRAIREPFAAFGRVLRFPEDRLEQRRGTPLS
jgi:hypothetical protein